MQKNELSIESFNILAPKVESGERFNEIGFKSSRCLRACQKGQSYPFSGGDRKVTPGVIEGSLLGLKKDP